MNEKATSMTKVQLVLVRLVFTNVNCQRGMSLEILLEEPLNACQLTYGPDSTKDGLQRSHSFWCYSWNLQFCYENLWKEVIITFFWDVQYRPSPFCCLNRGIKCSSCKPQNNRARKVNLYSTIQLGYSRIYIWNKNTFNYELAENYDCHNCCLLHYYFHLFTCTYSFILLLHLMKLMSYIFKFGLRITRKLLKRSIRAWRNMVQDWPLVAVQYNYILYISGLKESFIKTRIHD